MPLAIGARRPLQGVHRFAELLQVAEPLPPVVRHRDPHQVGEGTRQLRTGTLARIGSRLPREQLVSERAGGVDLHARLALRGSAALQQLGREITLLVLGALLVETAQLHRARPVEVYEPRPYGGLLRRRQPGDGGEEPQRLASGQLLSGRARSLEDVVQRDQLGAQPPAKSVSQRFAPIEISAGRSVREVATRWAAVRA